MTNVLPRSLPCLLALTLLSGAVVTPGGVHAGPATLPTDFVDERMADALDEPVGIAEIPDPASIATRRVLFVEQRTARVGLVIGTSVFTVGTVPGVSSAAFERGLLGVAVDPGFPARPYLYAHITDGRAGDRVAVSRFTLTGDLAFTSTGLLQFSAGSRYDLIADLPDDQPNHNGGTVRFGPDQRLYVSLGDDAQGCPALDITQPVGKILRLDVSALPPGPGGPAPIALLTPPDNPFATNADSSARLVWTYGLRNPFRFQIDPLSGSLFIADVGETSWEELDRAASGGLNMGWPVIEGPDAHETCSLTPPSAATAPISYYDHSTGVVIISGPLYRRPASGGLRFPPAYEGSCFFLDYYSGIMRRLKGSDSVWALASPAPGQPDANNWGVGLQYVSDMLELADGSIWYCRQFQGGNQSGELRRIRYQGSLDVPPTARDAITFAPASPSPSRAGVRLSWTQPRRERVQLAIFDLEGRRLRVLEPGSTCEPGQHDREWDGMSDSGRPAGPGVFFARLQVGSARHEVRITLLR